MLLVETPKDWRYIAFNGTLILDAWNSGWRVGRPQTTQATQERILGGHPFTLATQLERHSFRFIQITALTIFEFERRLRSNQLDMPRK